MKIDKSTLIICSIILGFSIFLTGGIYKYEKVNTGIVHKYNKFTGSMSLCHIGSNGKAGKCQPIGK